MKLLSMLILAAGFSISAQAGTIGFDDIVIADRGDHPILDGYAGIDWNGFYALNTALWPDSGYANAATSGSNVAFTAGSDFSTATFSSPDGSAFTFNGASLTAGWRDNLVVDVSGYRNGTVVDSSTLLVGTSGPNLATFNWGGVDSVSFTVHGGSSPVARCYGQCENLAIDDISLSGITVSSVPEPSTLAMFAAGALVIGLSGRRRIGSGAIRV